jgi:hypothetical protein
MADAIIGGLILSTVLSLFVVPAFYVLSDRLSVAIAGRRGRQVPQIATPATSEPVSPPTADAAPPEPDAAPP